jgi:hypothetical protein
MAAKTKKQKFITATLDIETDPFLFGRTPLPFACGFYDGENYHQTWGDSCIAEMMEYLDSLPDNYRIYVHNGGGFDFYFLQDFITNPLFFIKTRVAKCGLLDRHELRDSYKMLPIPLSAYAKEEIDYNKFEYGVRERHKQEILRYLFLDCKYLYDLVSAFITKFGDHLTIGSAAIRLLKRHHPNKHESTFFDALFREYYLGGRTECFEVGGLKGDFKIYDVNSMYPYVMAAREHPFGNQYKLTGKLPDSGFYFAKIEATSRGALPIRSDKGTKSISFPHGRNMFIATSHEIRQAQELGLLDIHRVIECRAWKETQTFATYVNECMAGKLAAEARGDKAERTFYKLLANNGYGKFGQDPRKYRDCIIVDSYDEAEQQGYAVSTTFGDRLIAEKPADLKPYSFNNVAIAASITSASRAELLRGIANAERPVYCDTDSIICEGLNMPLHPTELGAWKTEARLDRLYIAGKKLYAGFLDNKPAKKASKGVDLDHSTIAQIALGENEPLVKRDAPLLKFGQEAKFIARKITRTY